MNKSILFALVLGLAAFGCGDDDGMDTPDTGGGTDSGTDTGPDDEDAGDGEDAGDDIDTGPEGFTFRDDAPSAYTRRDRMGMPAIATAVISTDQKVAYNMDDPSDDAEVTDGLPKWAPEIATNLGGLHVALREDFVAAGLTTCEDAAAGAPPANALPCATQTVGDGGPTVLSLVAPDHLSLDTSVAPGERGFPNGRAPADPVVDVTLAVVLLDLTVHPATTFVTLDGPSDVDGLNPTANDVAFATTFPYFADPHPAP